MFFQSCLSFGSGFLPLLLTFQCYIQHFPHKNKQNPQIHQDKCFSKQEIFFEEVITE